MHPIINQRVGFHEAEITPYNNGTATVNFRMKNSTIDNYFFDSVTAHWQRISIIDEVNDDDDDAISSEQQRQSYFLTSASVSII